MFERLKTLFERSSNEAKLVAEEVDPVPLAAAMTLLEVAWADHELEATELQLIQDALETLYGISQDQSESIVDQARRQHDESTSIHPFTRELNENLNLNEKHALLVELWRMNNFDGSDFHYEESVIRKVSELLYMRHSEFIAAKLEAKQSRSQAD